MFADVDLRPASPEEIEDVLDVLNDAARRLGSRSIRQWPTAFRPEWIRSGLVSGQTWLARRAGRPIATITLGWSDPLWADDGLAGYVHRLARTHEAVGIGDHLLAWAADRVRERDRTFIRLDCVARRPIRQGRHDDREPLRAAGHVVGLTVRGRLR